MRGERTDSPRPERSDFRTPGSDQNKAQLDAINAKLDKLISLLEPKTIASPVSAPIAKTEKIADKVDLPKIKKAIKKATSAKKK